MAVFNSTWGFKGPTSMATEPGDESALPYATMVARSVEELRIKTELHDRLFQIGAAAWELDQDTGLITFTSPSGLAATAPAQIIGTYNTASGTWLWAWDNPSINPNLSLNAEIAREYGEKRGMSDLTERRIATTEDKCWEFTALACKLCNDQGAYRGPAGATMVFITFGSVKVGK